VISPRSLRLLSVAVLPSRIPDPRRKLLIALSDEESKRSESALAVLCAALPSYSGADRDNPAQAKEGAGKLAFASSYGEQLSSGGR
jgi:hypothetical protein